MSSHAPAACSPAQPALARPDLWLEFQLLEKLLYKNANQHRSSLHYRRLQEVCSKGGEGGGNTFADLPPAPASRPRAPLGHTHQRTSALPSAWQVRRLLTLLRSMQLDRRVAVLHEALEGARRRGGLPAGSVLLAYG